jgi:hypothetical protein
MPATARSDAVTFNVHAWKGPRELTPEAANALLVEWQGRAATVDGAPRLNVNAGPAASGARPRAVVDAQHPAPPFEPSPDVTWFQRELLHDHPDLEAVSDIEAPSRLERPIWLTTDTPPPARIVTIAVPTDAPYEVLETIFALAAKYDLVLYDARAARLRLPLHEMGESAKQHFWPQGAIQAAIAGGLGVAMAGVAWFVGAPIVSGVLVVVGGFLVVMAVLTFLQAGVRSLRSGPGGPGPRGGAEGGRR